MIWKTALTALILLCCFCSVFAQQDPDRELYFPQIVTGGGYRTTLFLANSSAALRRVALEFYGSTGVPLALPVNGAVQSQVVQDIQGYGSLRLSIAPVDGKGSLQVGWARVKTTSAVTGWDTIQTFSAEGKLVSQATVGPSEALEACSLGLDIGPATLSEPRPLASQVGLAVANPSAKAIRLRLVLVDEFGQLMAVKEGISVPAQGQWTQLLEQVFPDLAKQVFHGSLRIDSAGDKFTTIGAFMSEEEFSLVPMSASERLPAAPSSSQKLFDAQLPGKIISVGLDEHLNRAAVAMTTGLHTVDLATGSLLSSFPMAFNPVDTTSTVWQGKLTLDPRTHVMAAIAPGNRLILFDIDKHRQLKEIDFGHMLIGGQTISSTLIGAQKVPSLNSVIVTIHYYSTAFPFVSFRLLSLSDFTERSVNPPYALVSWYQPRLMTNFNATRALLLTGIDTQDLNGQMYPGLVYQQRLFPSMEGIESWEVSGQPRGYFYDGTISDRAVFDSPRNLAIAQLRGALVTLNLSTASCYPAFALDRSDYAYDLLSGWVAYSASSSSSVKFAEPTTGNVMLTLDAGFAEGRLAISSKARTLLVGDPASGRLSAFRIL